MKKLHHLPFLLFFIASLAVSPAVVCSQDGIKSSDEAKIVLEQYFSCLKNGNTSGILGLITGPLLEKREGLLRNNAQYGDFLQSHYKDAFLVITSGSFSNNNFISLRASIVFNTQQKTDFIFNFVSEGSNGSLKIHSEVEIP